MTQNPPKIRLSNSRLLKSWAYAQSGHKVAGEEEGRPASAEPAREEGSNKLNTSHKELEDRSNLLLNVDVKREYY